MSLYIAAYDIRHNGRRASVARVLLSYGQRVQRSVFEVWLESEEVPDLRREVGVYLGIHDHFDLIPIDQRDSRPRYSWQRPPATRDPVIMG